MCKMKKIIRTRGKNKSTDVAFKDGKFNRAVGKGTAKQLRRKR